MVGIPLHGGNTQTAQCLIIAEVAQSHDGSLGMAHAFIDAIANSGADAVKFQTHIADAESTLDEPWRVRFSPEDDTRYDYWKRMEFSEAQWHGLKSHASERGLQFLSSPFSVDAVDLLTKVGVAAWKIASGEVSNILMLQRMAETRLPFILSSGMSLLTELDVAVGWIKERAIPLTILQCTTAYPCPPEKVGLNMLEILRTRYDCPVGLSDHSGTIFPCLAAVTLGATVIEVHVTLSREMFGPDVPASVTTGELRQLVDGVRFIETMLANPVDKDLMAEEMTPLRQVFRKSVVVNSDLPAGTILELSHLDTKKPGTGIPADQIHTVVGSRLKRPVKANHVLSIDDLE